MSLVNLDQFRYQKYAKAVGAIDLSRDIQYINKVNKKDFEKEYIKAYLKLLSK